MSAGNDENDDVAPYRVGYSKPPQKHKFERGWSGNPKGRPRKTQEVRSLSNRLLGSDEPTTEMILEQGQRTVRIREGGRIIEMPVNEAIVIAMHQNALKGSRAAQRDDITLLRTSERERMNTALEYFTQLNEYKLEAKREFARYEKLGLAPRDFLPHPDDIEIDRRRRTADVHGPITPEEKRVWDLKLQRRDEAAKNVERAAHRYKRLRDPAKRKVAVEEWIRDQEVFDLINDRLPSRYKTTFANRHHSEANDTPEPSPRDDESEAT